MKFTDAAQPLKTAMIQVRTAAEAISSVREGLRLGADAFGLQLENLLPDERAESKLRSVFEAGEGKPFYVTSYRGDQNDGLSDDFLARQLLDAAEYGASLLDLPGDMFCRDDDQLTYSLDAITKQRDFTDKAHALGAEVVISSHVSDFRPEDYVLGMAFEQKRRGADISKIVTFSHTDEQLTDNLKTTVRLKEVLGIPFLFLTSGEKGRLHRLVGPHLGCCMWLCVTSRKPITTPAQPLIAEVKDFNKILSSRK